MSDLLYELWYSRDTQTVLVTELEDTNTMTNTNTVDEFIESLIVATVSKEVKWQAGSEKLQEVLEEVYGNSDKLYSFADVEAGANVVFASYQFYEGEVESDEFIKEGMSVLLVDDTDFEILNEVTDEDVTDVELFAKLVQAIEAK